MSGMNKLIEIRNLLQKGFSQAEIIQLCHCSYSTIQKAIKFNNENFIQEAVRKEGEKAKPLIQKELIPEGMVSTAKFDMANHPMKWLPKDKLEIIAWMINQLESRYAKKSKLAMMNLSQLKDWLYN